MRHDYGIFYIMDRVNVQPFWRIIRQYEVKNQWFSSISVSQETWDHQYAFRGHKLIFKVFYE
jgi:hypothetical protein